MYLVSIYNMHRHNIIISRFTAMPYVTDTQNIYLCSIIYSYLLYVNALIYLCIYLIKNSSIFYYNNFVHVSVL